MAGIPWDQVAATVVAAAVGAAGTGLFTMFRRGVVATVEDIATKEDPPHKATPPRKSSATPPPTCAQPCEGHIALRDETKKSMESMWTLIDSLTLSVQNHILPILSDVRADMAFIKARMDKKHTPEHLATVAHEIKPNEPLLLLVEDRPDTMRALINMIEAVGFDVMVAETEEEARALLSAVTFHYALMDADLEGLHGGSAPALDGVRLAEWACKVFPKLRVFIYSGYELDYIPAHCRFFNKQDFKLLLEALKVERARHAEEQAGRDK